MQIEKIMCAAIWIKDENVQYTYYPTNINYGLIVCGYRHHNCIEHISNLYDKKRLVQYGMIQGFLTNNNRFVDRKEARIIAENANQLIEAETTSTGNQLFSEDVWLMNN